jgi:dTDP-4-amino-4,6-dideoxygalactose transaminase
VNRLSNISIPFDRPPIPGAALEYISEVLQSRKLSGNGMYTKKCQQWFAEKFGATHNLLTTSGSSALDMAARLCDLDAGDEVIMPSFTFSSTANAFVACGAEIVFVDIRPDTMNIDENLIEAAVTPKTKVVVPVHYAGVACEMGTINDIAERHDLFVIEDAAQGVMSKYKGRPLGTFGDFACYSFHSTKNYSMGEGGAIVIRDNETFKRAEIMWEKGTDRSLFTRGEIDKYSWVDWGSSYLPSELNAAYLWSQLEIADEINNDRLRSYNRYRELLAPLADDELIHLPFVPRHCEHNAHIFFIKTRTNDEHRGLLALFKERKIGAVFHYVPLHSSKAGRKFGRFHDQDKHTTSESEKLIRLPLYYGLTHEDISRVAGIIFEFFGREVERQ